MNLNGGVYSNRYFTNTAGVYNFTNTLFKDCRQGYSEDIDGNGGAAFSLNFTDTGSLIFNFSAIEKCRSMSENGGGGFFMQGESCTIADSCFVLCASRNGRHAFAVAAETTAHMFSMYQCPPLSTLGYSSCTKISGSHYTTSGCEIRNVNSSRNGCMKNWIYFENKHRWVAGGEGCGIKLSPKKSSTIKFSTIIHNQGTDVFSVSIKKVTGVVLNVQFCNIINNEVNSINGSMFFVGKVKTETVVVVSDCLLIGSMTGTVIDGQLVKLEDTQMRIQDCYTNYVKADAYTPTIDSSFEEGANLNWETNSLPISMDIFQENQCSALIQLHNLRTTVQNEELGNITPGNIVLITISCGCVIGIAILAFFQKKQAIVLTSLSHNLQ